MTEGRRKVLYLYSVLWLIAYPIVMAYTLVRNPSELLFDLIAGLLFLLFYLVPFALFQARIEATSSGISVERWNKSLVEYSDVVGCYGVFWIPFQAAILITKRRFPLNIIISGDEIDGCRRSMFQRGALASSVASMKAAHDQR